MVYMMVAACICLMDHGGNQESAQITERCHRSGLIVIRDERMGRCCDKILM